MVPLFIVFFLLIMCFLIVHTGTGDLSFFVVSLKKASREKILRNPTMSAGGGLLERKIYGAW
jgi:hypothetical protein